MKNIDIDKNFFNTEATQIKWKSIKKYPCKKLKGEHDFVFINRSFFKLGNHTFYFTNFKCSACGKRKIKGDKKSYTQYCPR